MSTSLKAPRQLLREAHLDSEQTAGLLGFLTLVGLAIGAAAEADPMFVAFFGIPALYVLGRYVMPQPRQEQIIARMLVRFAEVRLKSLALITLAVCAILTFYLGQTAELVFFILAFLITSARRSSAPSLPRQRKLIAPKGAQSLREQSTGGFYLGHAHGSFLWAPAQSAGIILAGPRAGKTSCFVIPAILAHPGPVVATSTKPEVLEATLKERAKIGNAWYFDLSGKTLPQGAKQLRWSPLQSATDWLGAQLVAEAMAGVGESTGEEPHWRERAGALLAACFHAAAISGQSMGQVQSWILRHDSDSPLAELEAGSLAHDVLYGLKETSERERSGIFSTAARILRAYRSAAALATAELPNFDPKLFAENRSTIYIAAPSDQQSLLAPLVVGLLADIRRAAFEHHWSAKHEKRPSPMLFLLDECANIAPIPDLPSLLSEAGGQGLQVVCVFQDMSQVRRRWPRQAEGFMSLFGVRVILSGIADPQTLEQLSLICGEEQRPVHSYSHQKPESILLGGNYTRSESVTTRWERSLPSAEIARIRQGEALVMIGAEWDVIPVVPYDRDPALAGVVRSDA